MNAQQQLAAMARLAGKEPIEAGDLADMPIVGRVQVIRLLPAMQAEIRTSKGEVMTVRVQVLRRV